jgi:hypothetical protein
LLNMSYLWLDLGVGLLMGLWMYDDAKKRKLDNPSVWIWIGVLFGLIGLITYYFWHIRPKKKSH